MSTWHQSQRPIKLAHPTEWSVVIDPPGEMHHIYSTSTKELALVYMRNLQANNPDYFQHAYILPPARS